MKLDIGASYNTHRAGPGWICMDINNADILQDLSKFPWDIKSSSVDAINASHILEHLLKDNAYKFLNECNRILVPGGAISISVPNMDNFINYHLYNDKSFVGDYTKTDLNLNLGGVHEFTDPWQHKYMYNYETLAYMLDACRFIDISQHAIDQSPYPTLQAVNNPKHQIFSLYVSASKNI